MASNKDEQIKVTWEEFQAATEKFRVTPDKYTKPIRVYCDIDGVVKPFLSSQEDKNALDGHDDIMMFRSLPYTGDLVWEQHEFDYSKAAVAKLREWSLRDDVDFVWLTAWRGNAPYALDEVLGIKSLGFLDWQVKPSDYNHTFKGVAIEQDQEASPSKFIWLDDFANKRRQADVPYFTRDMYVEDEDDWNTPSRLIENKALIDPDRYIALTTEPYAGLTTLETDLVDAWLTEQTA